MAQNEGRTNDMPIIQSAKKRVRTAKKATVRNSKTKRTMREAIKEFRASLTSRSDSATALSNAQKSIDTAVKKGVLHKRRAARKKSQLASEAKAAGVKLAKKTTKASPATKKKTAAKKPAAKKTSTKSKSTTKKSSTPSKKK